MRKITMEVRGSGFRIEDTDEQFVEFDDDDKVDRYFLYGDETVVIGKAPRNTALVEAFKLLGVEYE